MSMSINRRHLMCAAAAAGTVAALPLTAARAQTPPVKPTMKQAPAFRRFSLGDWVVTAVADGGITMNAGVLPEFSEAQFAEAMEKAFLPADAFPASINTFLLQNGDRTILVDTGGSSRMGPTVGRTLGNLAAAGVEPGDIDTVLITHMHGDHIGGLIDGDGAAVFPNAEVVVRDRELAFWTDPEQASSVPERQRGTIEAATAVANAYEGNLTTFADDVAVVDGIEAMALYGHTPGHTGYRLEGGGQTLLIWGDIVHIAPVQLPDPSVYIGFDVTPEEAVATRQKLLDMVATERMMIAGMHMPFPAFGHIARDGDGYAFAPAYWQYSL
ncbi:MBL fold metallo-hydrolase [Acuticoccus sediminis]|uniref:MBL fold metallo-hydrolase n=1 Tax=Acuticoccus sediminis TaxID=2184697 RepID=UPI001CFD81FB|nr:MBL fold metallo-hydrolase [Acuticoccus sediminis]